MFGSRHVYCSIDKLDEALPHLIELKLGVEVVFDTTVDLWPQIRWEDLLRVADRLQDAGVAATVHGPFHGINPGSRDPHVREFSEASLCAAIEVAESLQSPLVVFHTGFAPQLAPKSRVKWMDLFVPALERVLEEGHRRGVLLAMENTYERDPSLFTEIFERVTHPHLQMCLDTGHAQCFGVVDPADWGREFADRICHVHLSDNDGQADLHWSLGRGVVSLESQLKLIAPSRHVVTVTYEVPLEDAAASDDYFCRYMDNLTKEEAG